MDLFKRLGLKVVSVALSAFGGVFIFTALGQSAFAVDINFAPEIDPSAITGAMTLLIGSVMLLAGKGARK